MPNKDITAHQRTRRWHDGLVAVNAADADTIEDALAVHGKRLDLDMASYNGLRDKTSTHTMLLDAIAVDPIASRDALAMLFDPFVALRASIEAAVDKVNISETAEILGGVLVDNALMLTLDLDDYNALAAAKKEAVHDAVFADIPFLDETALKTAFDAAVLAAQA